MHTVVTVRGPGSYGPQAPRNSLISGGTQTQLPPGMWDLPRPGIKPVSPALAGGFFTTEPPGKPEDPSYSPVLENSSVLWILPDGWPGFKSQLSHLLN